MYLGQYPLHVSYTLLYFSSLYLNYAVQISRYFLATLVHATIHLSLLSGMIGFHRVAIPYDLSSRRSGFSHQTDGLLADMMAIWSTLNISSRFMNTPMVAN